MRSLPLGSFRFRWGDENNAHKPIELEICVHLYNKIAYPSGEPPGCQYVLLVEGEGLQRSLPLPSGEEAGPEMESYLDGKFSDLGNKKVKDQILAMPPSCVVCKQVIVHLGVALDADLEGWVTLE